MAEVVTGDRRPRNRPRTRLQPLEILWKDNRVAIMRQCLGRSPDCIMDGAATRWRRLRTPPAVNGSPYRPPFAVACGLQHVSFRFFRSPAEAYAFHGRARHAQRAKDCCVLVRECAPTRLCLTNASDFFSHDP
jgi:hypothetical protein